MASCCALSILLYSLYNMSYRLYIIKGCCFTLILSGTQFNLKIVSVEVGRRKNQVITLKNKICLTMRQEKMRKKNRYNQTVLTIYERKMTQKSQIQFSKSNDTERVLVLWL